MTATMATMATIDANPVGHKVDNITFSKKSSYSTSLLPAFEPSTPSRPRQDRHVDRMSISSSVCEAQLPLPAQVSIKNVSIPHYCKSNGKWFYACRVVPNIVQPSSLSNDPSYHTTSSRRRESLGKMELAGCGRLGTSEPYTVFRSWSSFVELSQELAIAFPIISPYAYCSSGIPPTNYSKETPRLAHKRFPAWPASSTKTLTQRQADLERFVAKLFELPDVIRESSLVREFFAVDQVMSSSSLDLKKEQEEEQADLDTNPVETFSLPISQDGSSSSSSIVPQSVLAEFQQPSQSQTALSRRRLVTKRSSPDLRRRGCEEFSGQQLNATLPSPPLPFPIGFSMRSIISPTALLQQDTHRQVETESSNSSSETASFAPRQYTCAAQRPTMKDILNSGLMIASDNDNDNEDDYNSHDLNPVFLSTAHGEPIQSEIVAADLPTTTTSAAAAAAMLLPPPKKGFGGRTLRHFRSLQDLRQQSHPSTSQERTLAIVEPLPKNAAASVSMARAQTLPEAFQQQQQRTLRAQAQVRTRRTPLSNFSSPSSSAFASIPSTPISDKTSPIQMASKLAISEFSNSRQQSDSDSQHHHHRNILHGRSTNGSKSSMSSFDEVWRTHSSSGSSSSSSGASSMFALSPTTTASSSITTPGSFRHLPCGRLDRVPLSATSSPPLIPMTFPSLQQHHYQIRGDNGVTGQNGLERKRRPSMPSRSSSISKTVPILPLRNRSYSGTDSHHTPSPSACSLDSMMISIGGDAVCMGGRGGGVSSMGSRAATGTKNGGSVEMHRSMSDGTGGCSYDLGYSSPSTFPNIRKPSEKLDSHSKSQDVTAGSTGQYKSSSTTAPNSSSSSTFDSPMTLKNNCVPPPPFFPLPPSMTGGNERGIGHRSPLPLQQQQQLLASSSAMTSAYSQDGMPHPPRHASRTGKKYEEAAPADAGTTAGDDGKDTIDVTDSFSSLSMLSLSSSSSLTNSSSPISPISPGSPNFGYSPLLSREKALGGYSVHPTAGQNQLTRHRQQPFQCPKSQLHQVPKLSYTFKILHQNSNVILRVSSVNCTLKLLRESVEKKFLESSILLSPSSSSSSSSTSAAVLCSNGISAAVTTAQNSKDEDEGHVNVNDPNTKAGANADQVEMTSWKLAYMSPSLSSPIKLAHTAGQTVKVTLDEEKERKGGNTTTLSYKHNEIETPSLHITISKDQPTPTKLPTSLEYITTEKALIQLLERTDHLNKIPLYIIA